MTGNKLIRWANKTVFGIGFLRFLLWLSAPAEAQSIFQYDLNGNLTNVTTAGFGTPTIIAAQATENKNFGQDAAVSVSAAGTEPLTYQWYQNGIPVLGATNSTLFIPSVGFANQGNYTVVACNASGCVTSSVVSILLPSGINALTITGSSYAQATPSYTYTWGYEFQVTSPIIVNGLSAWDGGGGLNGQAIVGLWTNGGPLLVTTTIPTGTNAQEDGGFRWEPVASLTLQPGYYVVGACEGGPTAYFGASGTNMISTIPGVTYIEDRSIGNRGFSYPDSTDYPTYVGWFGGSVHVQTDSPVILQEPVSETVSVGDSAIFSVVATSGTPMYYQWQRNGTNLSNGNEISGVNLPSLTIYPVSTNDNGSYSVIVTNQLASVTSSIVSLTAVATSDGNILTMSGSPTATDDTTYTWGYEFQLTSAITINGLSVWDGGAGLPRDVLVGLWTLGGTLVDSATVPAGTSAPEDYGFRWIPVADLTLQPGFYVVGARNGGFTEYFTGNATNFISTLPGVSYVMDRFSQNPGLSYPGNSDFPGFTGWWGGSLHFRLQTPEITHQPVGVSVPVGESATFNVSATNATPLYYQWVKDGTNLANGGEFSGVTTPTLTVAPASSSDDGSYSVLVSNAFGAVMSSTVDLMAVAFTNANILTINGTPSTSLDNTYTWGFEFQVLPPGTTVDGLSVWDGGAGLRTNASVGLWTVAGTLLASVTIPAGTSAPEEGNFRWEPIGSLSLPPGFYVVGAFNGEVTEYFNGNATNLISTAPGIIYVMDRFGHSAALEFPGSSDFPSFTGWWGGSVHLLTNPSITNEPANVSAVIGGTATFTVSTSGTLPLYYQWKKNGTNLNNGGEISGATSATLTISPVSAGDGGNYSVIVSNSYGAETSGTATLTVSLQPNPYHIASIGGGNIQLNLAGIPNSTNRLWTTTNVALPTAQWQVIATNIMDTNGFSQFVDTNVIGSRTRYYRLSSP